MGEEMLTSQQILTFKYTNSFSSSDYPNVKIILLYTLLIALLCDKDFRRLQVLFCN